MKMPPISYQNYLKIDQLLDCQKMRSEEYGKPAHDEHLFIIVHQAYELWFSQMLKEVGSIIEIFKKPEINENQMGTIVARLERVHEIQRLIAQQIDIMETMTPMDFLDFRDLLYPAAGFQSVQFRLLENSLGLDQKIRLTYNGKDYKNHFSEEEQKSLRESEECPSLFNLLENWLERTPFLQNNNFDFWEEYKISVKRMFAEDKKIVEKNPLLGPKEINANLIVLEQAESVFESLFDEKKFNQLKEEGYWRLSHKAVLAALFIHLYRDQPVLHLPFRVINKLKDIDESLTHWRYRHSLMARRMLGTKIGTGGSSGAKYLRESTERHKIFTDLFQLTTFFIPRSQLPALPKGVEKELDFFYNSKT